MDWGWVREASSLRFIENRHRAERSRPLVALTPHMTSNLMHTLCKRPAACTLLQHVNHPPLCGRLRCRQSPPPLQLRLGTWRSPAAGRRWGASPCSARAAAPSPACHAHPARRSRMPLFATASTATLSALPAPESAGVVTHDRCCCSSSRPISTQPPPSDR